MDNKSRQYFSFSFTLAVFIAAISMVVNVLFLVVPLFSMQVFDRVLTSESYETLTMLIIITFFFVSIQSILEWIRSQITLRYGYRIQESCSALAFHASLKQSLAKNAIHSQALSDLERVRETVASPGIFALFDAPFVPIFLATMYLMHPHLGHFALAGAIVLFAISLLSMIVTKRLQERSSKNKNVFNALTSDWLGNAEIISALGMSQNLISKRSDEAINSTVDKANADNLLRGIMSLSKYIRMMLQVGILAVSVLLVLQNEVGAGVLIAASMIMARVLSPVEQAIHNWQHWVEGWRSHQRLNEVMVSLEQDRVELPKISGDISFDNVTLGHPNVEKPLLENLSFHIPAGTSVAIVGTSGVGKSTLAKAILGLVVPRLGEIRIDGATLNQIQREQFGHQVGYVSQNGKLLAGTIAQNICRFEENALSKDIVDAAKLAGVHEMILTLPNGYQTLVGSLGVRLSGGQQQRIAMARALYTKPTLLVLDEPDSSLDHQGQSMLMNFLAHAKNKSVTVVVISHRISILKHTTLAIALNGGKIEKIGATAEILGLPSSKVESIGSAL